MEFITQIGNGDLVDKTTLEDDDLLGAGKMMTLVVDGNSVQVILTHTERSSSFN
jgi:hypothetical protein